MILVLKYLPPRRGNLLYYYAFYQKLDLLLVKGANIACTSLTFVGEYYAWMKLGLNKREMRVCVLEMMIMM